MQSYDDEDADYDAFIAAHEDPEFNELLRLCHVDARGLQSIEVEDELGAEDGNGFAVGKCEITFRDGSVVTCTGWAWVNEFDEDTPPSFVDSVALDRAFANAARAVTQRTDG